MNVTELSAEILKAGMRSVPLHSPTSAGVALKAAVEELEQQMLQEALIACKYNQVQAAKRLGLSRQGLIKKLKRYNIVPRAGTQ